MKQDHNKNQSPLGLSQQLCFALYRASRAVVRSYDPLLEPLDITYPQYLALLVLWQDDEMSVKEIGEKLSLDSATLTPLLKRLEQKEIVVRERDKKDERVVHIKLTQKGKKLKTKAEGIPAMLACRGGFDITDKATLDQVADLRRNLHLIADKFDEK